MAQVVLDCFNVVSATDRGNSVGVAQIVETGVWAASSAAVFCCASEDRRNLNGAVSADCALLYHGWRFLLLYINPCNMK